LRFKALALLRTAVLSALIVTHGDVSEGVRLSRGHLVQKRVKEAEGLTSLLIDVTVDD